MTNEEKKRAAEYTVKLITKLMDKKFVDTGGAWTRAGRDHTGRCFNSRFLQFTQSQWDNMEDPASLMTYLLNGYNIWLYDIGMGEWAWCNINEPVTLDRWITTVNTTCDKLQISLGPDLETFDEDDLLDI